METCSFDNCGRVVYARGWCNMHYYRWWKHGDVNVNLHHDNRRGEAARFWEKVNKTDTCWIWTARLSSSGYGKFWTDEGKSVRSHRWSYQQVHGEIPQDLQLDHLCRNRACVNPDHLEAVTPRENTLRSNALGAINAIKTHCPQNHPYDDANTYLIPPCPSVPNGGRGCRTCRREAAARYASKKKVRSQEP